LVELVALKVVAKVAGVVDVCFDLLLV
jgi:hypothetical protein